MHVTRQYCAICIYSATVMQVSTCGSLPELSEPELDEAALGDLLGVRARLDGLFEEAEGSWVSGLTSPFTWASPPPNAKFIH